MFLVSPLRVHIPTYYIPTYWYIYPYTYLLYTYLLIHLPIYLLTDTYLLYTYLLIHIPTYWYIYLLTDKYTYLLYTYLLIPTYYIHTYYIPTYYIPTYYIPTYWYIYPLTDICIPTYWYIYLLTDTVFVCWECTLCKCLCVESVLCVQFLCIESVLCVQCLCIESVLCVSVMFLLLVDRDYRYGRWKEAVKRSMHWDSKPEAGTNPSPTWPPPPPGPRVECHPPRNLVPNQFPAGSLKQYPTHTKPCLLWDPQCPLKCTGLCLQAVLFRHTQVIVLIYGQLCVYELLYTKVQSVKLLYGYLGVVLFPTYKHKMWCV